VFVEISSKAREKAKRSLERGKAEKRTKVIGWICKTMSKIELPKRVREDSEIQGIFGETQARSIRNLRCVTWWSFYDFGLFRLKVSISRMTLNDKTRTMSSNKMTATSSQS
jgi:hypothetical protein